MMGYNVEFKLRSEWYAQHTGLVDKDAATGKAQSLWRVLHVKHMADKAFGGVRITEGLPFEKVVAQCSRSGLVNWL
jgi:hypothetical protein